MSKKDFESIADALNGCKALSGNVDIIAQWHKCLVAISRVCKESNPRFDQSRFEHRAVNGHNLTKKCGCFKGGKVVAA